VAQASQVVEKSSLVVILSEAKNLSRFKAKTKRDSSRKIGAQNDSFPLFFRILFSLWVFVCARVIMLRPIPAG
jgi:hypothetical protein